MRENKKGEGSNARRIEVRVGKGLIQVPWFVSMKSGVPIPRNFPAIPTLVFKTHQRVAFKHRRRVSDHRPGRNEGGGRRYGCGCERGREREVPTLPSFAIVRRGRVGGV